ncbi:MAG TPA: glycosyltransferase family A protein, partial [Chitinophagaceae bacterium]
MSRVSVLIPCFQAAGWLRRTIESCVSQQGLLEIIIVDDGSTDGSLAILQELATEHPGIVKVYNNPAKGGNNARNYAFSLSEGDYIQWLDADDQLGKGKLENQLKLFDSDASADIVYSDWELDIYDEVDLLKKEIKVNGPKEDFLLALLKDQWSSPNTYLLKRAFAQQLHDARAWNPDTVVKQDREYFTIAAILGARFRYVPGVYAIYNRWNKSSVSAASGQLQFQAQEILLRRFETMIGQAAFTEGQKRSYYNSIDTERVLLN